MSNEPSVLENLPDKVLRIALNIIEPGYAGYDDFEFDDDFTNLCDDVIKMTSLRKHDTGEIEDYSFLYELFRLNVDFKSSPDVPLIRPKFNLFTIDWEIEERQDRIQRYQHASGSYEPDGYDLENIYRKLFSNGDYYVFDGTEIYDEVINSELEDYSVVPNSIKKI